MFLELYTGETLFQVSVRLRVEVSGEGSTSTVPLPPGTAGPLHSYNLGDGDGGVASHHLLEKKGGVWV